MSPRAAWRLESLGFERVYDYVSGKQDWLAAGLPVEGERAAAPRAGDVARTDAATCRPDERLGEVRSRVAGSGMDTCVVTNDAGIVLGLLRADELRRDRESPIEEVMLVGPSTFRPHVPIEQLARFMEKHDLPSSPVTTSDGRLVGLLLLEDAKRAADRK